MATTIIRLFAITLLISISSQFPVVESRSHKSNLTWWCNLTPNPEPCEYFTRKCHPHFLAKHRSEFRKISVQVALDRALHSRRQVVKFRKNCRNSHERNVWSDCLKLHTNTILQLNRTLQGLRTKKSTTFDAQTWLNTALTNIQTCQTGSLDLNLSDFITPILPSSLSQLISNSLAVNGMLLEVQDNNTQMFPNWFSRQERRLLQSGSLSLRVNLVVPKDGSGHYRMVQAALNAAAKRLFKTKFVIHVKRGVYRENIEVQNDKNNIWLVGDGMRNTIITSGRSVAGGYTTYSSATAGIDGLRFVARGITFQNTAGPTKGQAVALRSASDLSVFYRCAFQGYQDTLFVHSQRQFYRECYIYVTIDFIFGNAAVVFQSCLICVRRPLKGQPNVITAHGYIFK